MATDSRMRDFLAPSPLIADRGDCGLDWGRSVAEIGKSRSKTTKNTCEARFVEKSETTIYGVRFKNNHHIKDFY
jgi:hypothetical protein